MKPSVPIANVPSANQYGRRIADNSGFFMFISFETVAEGFRAYKMTGRLILGAKKCFSCEDAFECDLHEPVEGRFATLDARAKQRAFVGIEQKGCDLRGVSVARYSAVGLAVFDRLFDIPGPTPIKLRELSAYDRALI